MPPWLKSIVLSRSTQLFARGVAFALAALASRGWAINGMNAENVAAWLAAALCVAVDLFLHETVWGKSLSAKIEAMAQWVEVHGPAIAAQVQANQQQIASHAEAIAETKVAIIQNRVAVVETQKDVTALKQVTPIALNGGNGGSHT